MQVVEKNVIASVAKGLLVSAVLVLLAGCGNDTPQSSAQVQSDVVSDDPQIEAASDSAEGSDSGGESDSGTEGATSATAETAETTATATAAAEAPVPMAAESGTVVVMKTSLGDIELLLDSEKAPLSVENFLAYVDSGHYAGTVFHRVIPDFMVQGGGFDEGLEQKQTQNPVKNEATNGLKNQKYTVAMARTSVVDSATTQFFINVADNAFLDHRDTSNAGFGYAVFGEVVSGQEVVDQMAAVPTGAAGRFQKDVPLETIVIESVTRK